jgi:hypothetical protein
MQEHRGTNEPNGNADLSRINGTARSHGEPQLDPVLHALCAASAPGVFAICETGGPLGDTLDYGDPGSLEADDTGDGPRPPRILAWGLDFGENAVLTGCDGKFVARLSSPARAQRLYRQYDTRLITFRTA